MKFKIRHCKSLTEYYRESKPFSIVDVIIIAIVVIAIILCCVVMIPSSNGEVAVIYHEGKIIGRYSLNNDITVNLLDNKMTFTIKDGKAGVSYSDCKNLICVRTGEISKSGERIVCAPNKVTIVIEGKEKAIITGGEI